MVEWDRNCTVDLVIASQARKCVERRGRLRRWAKSDERVL